MQFILLVFCLIHTIICCGSSQKIGTNWHLRGSKEELLPEKHEEDLLIDALVLNICLGIKFLNRNIIF